MKNVRKLTEGAILLAVFTVLVLIVIYVPLLASILNFVLPFPFILFSAKNSVKYSVAFFFAAIFLSFIAGSFMGLAVMLLYGSTGMVIGYLLQKGKSRTAILIPSSLTFMAGVIIFYIVVTAFLNMDIIREFTTALNQSIKESEQMLNTMKDQEQVERVKKQYANAIEMIETLLPSALILGSILTAFIIQWVCFPIAKRFGIKVQPWGKFSSLSLPRSLLWYLLIATGANVLLKPDEGTFFFSVLANAVYILGTFMVLQGLSFLFFIFEQKSVPKGLRILTVILAFMIPSVRYIIMILGIVDLGFDFRKRFANKE